MRVLLGLGPYLLGLRTGSIEDPLGIRLCGGDDAVDIGPHARGAIGRLTGLGLGDCPALGGGPILLRPPRRECELEVFVGLGGPAARVGHQALRRGAQAGDLLHRADADGLGLVFGQREDLLDAWAEVAEGDLTMRGVPARLGDFQLQFVHLRREDLYLSPRLVALDPQRVDLVLGLAPVGVDVALPVAAYDGREVRL